LVIQRLSALIIWQKVRKVTIYSGARRETRVRVTITRWDITRVTIDGSQVVILGVDDRINFCQKICLFTISRYVQDIV
jgi:hypothetical protein